MVYEWPDHPQRGWPSRLLDALLPPRCCLCLGHDSAGRGLCPACLTDLPWLTVGCPRCALPLPAPGHPCGACQRRAPQFDQAVAVFSYAPPVDRLIQWFKFSQMLQYAPLFAELIALRLADRERPECIIPVPLHPLRQRERGFNQAVEIARPLARRLGCRLDLESCTRVQATAPQSRLTGAQRRRNLRDAFAVRMPPARHVALVDDVMTTGSTLNALARRLREVGVARVDVWVVARTAGPDQGLETGPPRKC